MAEEVDTGWHFRKMERAEIAADPVQGEFFTPEGLADGLVREVIQNSLDAAMGKGPVRLRIAFSAAPLSKAAAAVYVAGLADHLKACLGSASTLSEPMDFIVIEDFGTRGLRGDPRQADDDEPADDGGKNDFFYFWRNVGRSGKSDTDRGRWGLGKTVLPATSRINAFYGLTVREGDAKALLMGQTTLKVHKASKKRLAAYGYFTRPEEDGFALPLHQARVVRRFKDDFGLIRDDEPGLSLVIPYPKLEEVEPEDLVRSTVMHYFYPILSGDLEVEVVYAENTHKVSKATIDDLVAKFSWKDTGTTPEKLRKLFHLARWALKLPKKDHVQLAQPGAGAPEWSEALFPAERLASLRELLDKGERIALRVPVKVHPTSREATIGTFAVYLEKDDFLSRGEDHYIRQGITISDISLLRDKPIRGLVVVEEKVLSSMLGDSENPAHTEWQTRSGKLRDRYQYGSSSVAFVRASLREIAGILTRPLQGLDRDLLADMFSIDIPDAIGQDGSGAGKGKGKKKDPPAGPPPPPDPPSTPQAFRVVPSERGFRVIGRKDSAIVGRAVRVQLAYEVRRGNAFKRYDVCDFNVKDLELEHEGIVIDELERNQILFRVQRDDFALRVTGFDPNRDLSIRARATQEDGE
jgi:hypothetical protein